jgi:SPX domain protein involved in polyphosphate accumulation
MDANPTPRYDEGLMKGGAVPREPLCAPLGPAWAPATMIFSNSDSRDMTSRFECKYILPLDRVPEIRAEILPFVEPDRHARHLANYRYTISSLYLDSADLLTFRMTDQGIRNRFKLRVRSYSDEPSLPVFFEVKKRVDGIVRKWRCAVRRSMAHRFLNGEWLDTGGRDPAPDLGEFRHFSREIVAGPVMRVRYQREAYEARGGEPTRITFDTDLDCATTLDDDLSLGGTGWREVLHDRAILEIKFTERFPTWIQDLVDRFELQRISVPKYCMSVERARKLGDCTLPVLGHRALVTLS